ncbi:Unconventional myosin-Ie [Homalodisca vitripennis]|nr:Unconventional myosin-Ie [Homalodisca vitripennis]
MVALVHGKKQRRKYSINRYFTCDYIGLDSKPGLQNLIGRREKVVFAETVKKYDRRFKVARRDLILTSKALYLIGRERVKRSIWYSWQDPNYQEVVKRKIDFDQIGDVTLSPLQDDFVVIHLKNDYDSLLEIVFKTEFLCALAKQYRANSNRDLPIRFLNSCEFRVKKLAWGGGGVRTVKFVEGSMTNQAVLTTSGKTLTVTIGPGLPADSRPVQRVIPTMTRAPHRPAAAVRPPAPARTAPPPPPVTTIFHPRGSIRAPPPPSEPAPPNQPKLQRVTPSQMNQGLLVLDWSRADEQYRVGVNVLHSSSIVPTAVSSISTTKLDSLKKNNVHPVTVTTKYKLPDGMQKSLPQLHTSKSSAVIVMVDSEPACLTVTGGTMDLPLVLGNGS